MEQVYGVRATGVMQEITDATNRSARVRLDVALAQAEATQRHVWILVATHLMSDRTARELVSGDPAKVSFDTATLAGTEFGCLICEQQLSPELIGKRCPGDPGEGAGG